MRCGASDNCPPQQLLSTHQGERLQNVRLLGGCGWQVGSEESHMVKRTILVEIFSSAVSLHVCCSQHKRDAVRCKNASICVNIVQST